MMDTQWGVGVASAPPMTGFGPVGFPDNALISMCDDEIEGMIDGLGLFQENDHHDSAQKNDKEISSSNETNHTDMPCQTSKVMSDALAKPKYAMVSPPHLPIFTNDTGAIVSIPDITMSSNPEERRSINYSTPIASPDAENCGIALPQPPQLVTSSVGGIIDGKTSIDSVLEHQRKTILKNQQIIEAQKNELEGRRHTPLSQSPIPVVSTPAPNPALAKTSASYSLARAALKKADEHFISLDKTLKRGTKRKANSSNASNSTTQANAYQKWKLTPAGATKLKTVDLGGIKSCRSPINKPQEEAMGRNLSPGELEVRRERNRKHAKKSRMRKKCLTTTLEQSLEVLREENTKLRKRIEDHLAATRKDQPEEATSEPTTPTGPAAKPTSVDDLLDDHRLRSHQKFIADIRASRGGRKQKKKNSKKATATSENDDGGSNHKKKISTPGSPDEKASRPTTGKGIVLDDKTLKALRGLSKSIVIPAADASKQHK